MGFYDSFFIGFLYDFMHDISGKVLENENKK